MPKRLILDLGKPIKARTSLCRVRADFVLGVSGAWDFSSFLVKVGRGGGEVLEVFYEPVGAELCKSVINSGLFGVC